MDSTQVDSIFVGGGGAATVGRQCNGANEGEHRLTVDTRSGVNGRPAVANKGQRGPTAERPISIHGLLPQRLWISYRSLQASCLRNMCDGAEDFRRT